jgi:hypothetical protein
MAHTLGAARLAVLAVLAFLAYARTQENGDRG